MNGADSARLELFRQLKKEVRGSERYLIVGIDIAKEKHNAPANVLAAQTESCRSTVPESASLNL